MTKSVLVIDTPSRCAECPLMSRDYSRGFAEVCNASAKNFLGEAWKIKDIFDVRPDWCPLKPMPVRHEMVIREEGDDPWMDGWNACIDELEGTDE